MARPNSLQRAGLQSRLARGRSGDPFRPGFKKLRAFAGVVGEGTSPPIVAAAKVLRKGIRKVLNIRGGVSKPGEPPHRHKGKLYKSIRYAVVGGVMRVGTNYFTGRLLEGGVNFEGQTARKRGAVKFIPLRGARAGKLTSKRARRAKSGLHIAPRPFMEAGLTVAQHEMTDAVVTTLRAKGPAS